jgi:2-polyprenyl-3-methyl-5-hydroxy-6-metoxy-1,4-benzoquinol methylase
MTAKLENPSVLKLEDVTLKEKEERVLWEEVDCDFCGSGEHTDFLVAEEQRSNVGRPLVLVACRQCGLVYQNPRPTRETIGGFYGADYYAHGAMAAQSKTLRGRLRARFLEGLGGYGTGPDLRLIQRLAPVGWVDVIIPHTRQGTLLDVGCGDGQRAAWYQQRGFQSYGVDVSEAAVEKARERGLPVRCGSLAEANYPDRFFDVVILVHVLEHTHSPCKALAECFRILKPGGLLAVAVPNIASHSARVFGADWSFLMLPIHLYHFSVDTLSAYLRGSGFNVASLVGKTVYPRMARSSCRKVKRRRSSSAYRKAWISSGVLASGLAVLKDGVSKCDTITAYCTRPEE